MQGRFIWHQTPNQCVRTWRPPLRSARRGPRRRRSSTPGYSSWTRSQHPSSRGRGTEGLCLAAASLHSGHLRGIGPRTGNLEGSSSPATERPGIRRLRIGLPARQRRLRDACGLSRLNDFLALRPQAHMPSCNRQVTSTWIHMAKPGPASAPRGHAPLYTDTLSLARTISADFVRDDDQVPWLTDVYRSSSSAYRGCPAERFRRLGRPGILTT